MLVEQICMFSDPADAGGLGQGLFHYRCAVGKCTISKRPDSFRDAVRQSL